ncbi:MAG: thiamine pyrophosphate-binding protein [bacterium]
MADHPSIGQYLLQQLYERGVRHVFGIPGDYVLKLYTILQAGPIRHVGTCREDGAGFAADAYARVNGLGAVCITYCVGGLNTVNPVAGAYAEKSPVVVISGAPGLKERVRSPLLHHRVRDFSTQLDIFSHITVAHTALEDPDSAYGEIDRVLDAVERYKRPGYIEIPWDLVESVRPHRRRPMDLAELTDPRSLEACIEEACAMIESAERPVILAGVEVHRFGYQDALIAFAEKKNIPIASTILGKSVVSEEHPLYVGVYEGAMGRSEVQEFVESSDCVILLGAFMTDINLGIYTARLDPGQAIYATSERVSVKDRSFQGVPFRSFMSALLQARIGRRPAPRLPVPPGSADSATDPDAPIRIRSLFQVVDEMLRDDTIVVSDVGDCLFGSVDLTIHRKTEFLCPAYYASMGFGVPGSIGAQLADPRLRPLVLVGDGAFQMTGLELSTAARLDLDPIVVVLNNCGYSTERQITDGPFNDIRRWDYARVPDLLGAGRGFVVRTPSELRRALKAAQEERGTFTVVDVRLDPYDKSPAMARLAERLASRT